MYLFVAVWMNNWMCVCVCVCVCVCTHVCVCVCVCVCGRAGASGFSLCLLMCVSLQARQWARLCACCNCACVCVGGCVCVCVCVCVWMCVRLLTGPVTIRPTHLWHCLCWHSARGGTSLQRLRRAAVSHGCCSQPQPCLCIPGLPALCKCLDSLEQITHLERHKHRPSLPLCTPLLFIRLLKLTSLTPPPTCPKPQIYLPRSHPPGYCHSSNFPSFTLMHK